MRKINIEKLLSKFKPHDNYSVEEFYCVSMMRLKKNDKFSIKLVHDYKNGNSISSQALEVDDLELALDIYRALDTYAGRTKRLDADDDIYDVGSF